MAELMSVHHAPTRSNSLTHNRGENKCLFSEFLTAPSPCTGKVTHTFIHPLSADISQGTRCAECSCLGQQMSLAHLPSSACLRRSSALPLGEAESPGNKHQDRHLPLALPHLGCACAVLCSHLCGTLLNFVASRSGKHKT